MVVELPNSSAASTHLSALKFESVFHILTLRGKNMRPEKVTSWREKLPPPFNKPSPILRRRESTSDFDQRGDGSEDKNEATRWLKRRDSISGALERTDRRVNWFRFTNDQYRKRRSEDSSSAVDKLRR